MEIIEMAFEKLDQSQRVAMIMYAAFQVYNEQSKIQIVDGLLSQMDPDSQLEILLDLTRRAKLYIKNKDEQ